MVSWIWSSPLISSWWKWEVAKAKAKDAEWIEKSLQEINQREEIWEKTTEKINWIKDWFKQRTTELMEKHEAWKRQVQEVSSYIDKMYWNFITNTKQIRENEENFKKINEQVDWNIDKMYRNSQDGYSRYKNAMQKDTEWWEQVRSKVWSMNENAQRWAETKSNNDKQIQETAQWVLSSHIKRFIPWIWTQNLFYFNDKK